MEAAHADEILRVGQLEIWPTEGLVLAAGLVVNLAPREFGLLVALAERQGHIVAREDLYARVWGGVMRDGDRSVDVYVRKLRVKLEEALPHQRLIHTHVRFGYRLHPESVASSARA